MLRNTKNALWMITLIGSMLTTTHLAGVASSCPRRCRPGDIEKAYNANCDDIEKAYNANCIQLKPAEDMKDPSAAVPDIIFVGGLCDTEERFEELINYLEQNVKVKARPTIIAEVITLGIRYGSLRDHALSLENEVENLKNHIKSIIDKKKSDQKVLIMAYSFGATIMTRMLKEDSAFDESLINNSIDVIPYGMCFGFANSRSNAWYYMERKLFNWFGIFKYSGAIDYRLAQWRRLPEDKQIAILSLITLYKIIEECGRISEETYEMLPRGDCIKSIRYVGIFKEDRTVDNLRIGEFAVYQRLNPHILPGDHTSHFNNPEPLAQWIQELLSITISSADLQQIIELVLKENQTQSDKEQLRQRLSHASKE
jgi:hypothetical protein